MGKYGNIVYGGSVYGATPKLAYSVEPMSVTVLDYDKTFLEWQQAVGNFSRIRLVRSQTGYPENEEDGVIVWEEYATTGAISRLEFIDSEDAETEIISIQPGRQIYYRIFLYIETNYWVVAGQVTDTIPLNHQTQQRIMDIIPKVYTSSSQSPLDVTDTSSTLYKFMEGVSFTVDQVLTQIDLLKPNHSSESTPASLLPAELLNSGFTTEQNLPLKYQKKLGRDAVFLYANRGLQSGLEAYIEDLTGYAPTITVSPNLLLTVQDSTFLNSIGSWQTSTTTLTSTTEQVPIITDYVIDETYAGKAIAASGSSYITLGADDPIRKGIPVVEDTDFTFGYKYKSPTSAGSVRLVVKFYDREGVDLASDFTGTLNAANNTWQTSWQTTTTPVGAVYASLKVTFSAAGTYYLDQFYAENGENLDNTSFQEARAISIFLNPNKINYIQNPSFEDNTNTWTITATSNTRDTVIQEGIGAGDYSLSLNLNTGAVIETESGAMPTLDKYYTLSFYAKATDAIDVDVTLTPNDDGTPTVGEETGTFTLSTDWKRYTLTAFVNDSDVEGELTYTVNLDFDTASGETVWVDAFQLEPVFKATDYFDGSFPTQYGAVWGDTAHESTSYIYVNKPIKLPRLSQTLDDWVPANAIWRLTSYAGVEYTSLTV